MGLARLTRKYQAVGIRFYICRSKEHQTLETLVAPHAIFAPHPLCLTDRQAGLYTKEFRLCGVLTLISYSKRSFPADTRGQGAPFAGRPGDQLQLSKATDSRFHVLSRE